MVVIYRIAEFIEFEKWRSTVFVGFCGEAFATHVYLLLLQRQTFQDPP